MKKQDFIKAVAAKAGLSQDAVAKSLTSMIEVITKSLKKCEKIQIPAMKTPVFRAGKTLKESVR